MSPIDPFDTPDLTAAHRAFAAWADAEESRIKEWCDGFVDETIAASEDTFADAIRRWLARHYAEMREPMLIFGYECDRMRRAMENLREPLLLIAAMPLVRDRRDQHKHNLMRRYRPCAPSAGRHARRAACGG